MSLEKETRDVQNKVLNKNNLKLRNWNSGYSILNLIHK